MLAEYYMRNDHAGKGSEPLMEIDTGNSAESVSH